MDPSPKPPPTMIQHSRAFSRALTRLLLALLLVTCLTVVFIGRCGLNLDQEDSSDSADRRKNGAGTQSGEFRRRNSRGASALLDDEDDFLKDGAGRHPRSRGVASADRKSKRRHAPEVEIESAGKSRQVKDDSPEEEEDSFLKGLGNGGGGGGGGGEEPSKPGRRRASLRRGESKMREEDVKHHQMQETQQLQQQTDHLRHLLAQREELHRGEISKLRQQIDALRQQIADKSLGGGGGGNQRSGFRGNYASHLDADAASQHDFHNFVRQSGIEGPPPPQLSLFEEQRLVNAKLDVNKFVDARLEESEILHGQAMRTEYEVIPYNRFTLTRLFLVDPGLGRRVVEKPIGLRKKEILQVVGKGVEILNHRHIDDDDEDKDVVDKQQRHKDKKSAVDQDLDDILQHTFVVEDFAEGIYRTEPGVGTHYELYFRAPKGGALQEQPTLADVESELRGKSGQNKTVGKNSFASYGEATVAPGGLNYGGGGGGGGGGVGANGAGGGAYTPGTSPSDTKLKMVTLFRPFAPLQLVKTRSASSSSSSFNNAGPSSSTSSSSTSPHHHRQNPDSDSNPWINLILPLSGRIDKFRSFIEKFVRVCVKQDKRVFLTVVYFGEPGLKEVTNILGGISKLYAFKALKLVTVNDATFSRGKGLQVGVEAWGSGSSAAAAAASTGGGAGGGSGKDKDVLMFLCDVDIIFNAEFLERCRRNTSPGEKVYYPILFSLYNPNIVYSLHDVPIPPELDQLVISKDTGWWRDFGYGMTCQYRSDFLAIKGFDEEIQGWGGEDVGLYRKYVKSKRRVIRAVDPGIFHMWHEKNCDPNLSADQYRNCIRSKALNEASHAQLGLLAFKDEIDIHRSYLKKDEIKNIPQTKINR